MQIDYKTSLHHILKSTKAQVNTHTYININKHPILTAPCWLRYLPYVHSKANKHIYLCSLLWHWSVSFWSCVPVRVHKNAVNRSQVTRTGLSMDHKCALYINLPLALFLLYSISFLAPPRYTHISIRLVQPGIWEQEQGVSGTSSPASEVNGEGEKYWKAQNSSNTTGKLKRAGLTEEMFCV